MTKTPLVITGMLFSGALVALSAHAPTSRLPAAAPAAKPAAAPAAADRLLRPPPSRPPHRLPRAGAPEAAAAPPAGPPTPAPEVDQLFKGYEGSWKCESTFNAGAFGPGSPETKVKSDVKIKKDPGGFWYQGEYKVKKSKMMPEFGATFISATTRPRRSPSTSRYRQHGRVLGRARTRRDARQLTFTGEQTGMGMKMKVKETMTKKDAKTVEHTFEVDMGKGFQQMGVDLCKK